MARRTSAREVNCGDEANIEVDVRKGPRKRQFQRSRQGKARAIQRWFVPLCPGVALPEDDAMEEALENAFGPVIGPNRRTFI